MDDMFTGCINLESLNLINFNITNVKRMGRMFRNCVKLTSLDLSNFKTKKLESNSDEAWYWISEMFNGCISLTFINLENFDLNAEYTNRYVFNNTPDNIIVCSNDEKWNIILNGTNISINCTIENKQYKCFIKNILEISNNDNICNLCNLCYNNDVQVYNYSIINDSIINDSYINSFQINLSNTLNVESLTTEITEEISYEKMRKSSLKDFNNTIILEGNDIEVKVESEDINLTEIESLTTEITEEISYEKMRKNALKDFNNTIILEGNDIKIKVESEDINLIWT
jgi:surface protein